MRTCISTGKPCTKSCTGVCQKLQQQFNDSVGGLNAEVQRQIDSGEAYEDGTREHLLRTLNKAEEILRGLLNKK